GATSDSLSACLRCSGHRRLLHAFPTRRSSDLAGMAAIYLPHGRRATEPHRVATAETRSSAVGRLYAAAGRLNHVSRTVSRLYRRDRKSTRLNSSHVKISYAVFCLKKKNEEEIY